MNGAGCAGCSALLDRPLQCGLAERGFDEIADVLEIDPDEARALYRSAINKLRKQRHILPRMAALHVELENGRFSAHTLQTGEIRAARRRGGRA